MFKVEAMLNRASEKLINLIDRSNNMVIRNVKAIRDLKSGSLSIRTDQVNIAQQQVNQVVKGKPKRVAFSVIDRLCMYFQCQPGDLFVYVEEPDHS